MDLNCQLQNLHQIQIQMKLMFMDEVSFENAKKEEHESWKKNHVYTEIEDNGQSCVSTRWVCTLKETKDEVKTNARLVVRGLEEIG